MIRVLPDLKGAEAQIAARGGELGRPLHLLGETTSTNDEAKLSAKRGAPHGSTWVAESQLAGRGRQGRAWVAEPGEALLFSVLLRLACPVSRLPLLALVAGLAVRDAVGAPALLKWPNDVVYRDPKTGALKKMAGILVESTMSGRSVEAVVVGIGINVHSQRFPPELAASATSVSLVRQAYGSSSAPPDRAELLAGALAALDRDARLVAARGLGVVMARLSGADALRGARVKSDLGEGVADGIDGDGRLVVRADDGSRMRWGAGEVHLAGSARAGNGAPEV